MIEWEKRFLESNAATIKRKELQAKVQDAQCALDEHDEICKRVNQAYYETFNEYLKELEYKKERGL